MSYHRRAVGRPKSWPRPIGQETRQQTRHCPELDVRIVQLETRHWLIEWDQLDGNGTEGVQSMRVRQWHTALAYAMALLSGSARDAGGG